MRLVVAVLVGLASCGGSSTASADAGGGQAGEVCGGDAPTCAAGLVCCYPCGIPGCQDLCRLPCGADGGACSPGGCPLVP